MNKMLLIACLLFAPVLKGQTIATFAGNGLLGNTGDDGLAVGSKISYPGGGIFDRDGNYYFATSSTGNTIRMVDPSGIIHTIAGTGVAGYSGDNGPATAAQLKTTQAIAIDTLGDIYIADAGNYRIRKVERSTGIITTVAGSGIGGYGGDNGPATAAKLLSPLDICFDAMGNLYIADNANARVRKVNTAGIITTVAGTGIPYNSTGGGKADTTPIVGASGLCVDDTGNLYIADWHARVYKITPSGIIMSIVGNGTPGFSGDGGPANTASTIPNKIALDKNAILYVAEYDQSRIRRVTTSEVISTFSGNGTADYGGDGGPAIDAKFNHPAGLAFDACGNLYIPDCWNFRIRKVTFNPITTPSISITSTTTVPLGSAATVTATVSGVVGSYSIKWYNRGWYFATTTAPSITYTKAAGTDTITAWVLPAAVYCYDSAQAPQLLIAAGPPVVNGVNSVVALPVSIYPNPAHTQLSITSGRLIESISITNLMGQAVLHTNYTSPAPNVVVDISMLPAGVYVIRINDTYVQRLIKE